jgi:hypothetical protein
LLWLAWPLAAAASNSKRKLFSKSRVSLIEARFFLRFGQAAPKYGHLFGSVSDLLKPFCNMVQKIGIWRAGGERKI